ncbi:MAG: transcription-repair coupling factor [Oscillospiraceae bacterium]|jgi:transcription-repair coupling factor (superfamily II helicase)|nr:transcription-repair coupling factor [Oscillospiraceae bacterium]
MKFLKNIMNATKEYNKLQDAIDKEELPVQIAGISKIHASHLIYTLCEQKNKALLLTHSEASATVFAQDLCAMGCRAFVFPWRDFEFRDILLQSKENEQKRVSVLSNILLQNFDVIVACVDAASKYTVPPGVLSRNIIKLQKGAKFSIDKLRNLLNLWGYCSYDKVEAQGQFSLRGGILDVFINNENYPVRMEFFGNEIDSISYFDAETQQRQNQIDSITIVPATEIIIEDFADLKEKIKNLIEEQIKEGRKNSAKILELELEKLKSNKTIGSIDKFLPVIYKNPCSLMSYFKNDEFLFIFENAKIKDLFRAQELAYQEDLRNYLENGILTSKLCKFGESYIDLLDHYQGRKTIYLQRFTDTKHEVPPKTTIEINALIVDPQKGSFEALCKDLNRFKDSTRVILAGKENFCIALGKDLNESEIPNVYLKNPETIPKTLACVMSGGLSSGFFYPDLKFALMTYKKVISLKKPTRAKIRHSNSIIDIQQLKVGDYVVHSSYGVGIFLGIFKINADGVLKDYIRIKYAKDDILYVPVVQTDMLSKYIGPKESSIIRLSRLGTDAWKKTKSKVRKAAKVIAEKLCVIYWGRMRAKGYAFPEDTEWQRDFEAKFEYVETKDQLRCIDEIKKDMQSSFPMDRLLCGDVGFGKTEVALRAAFKCVSNCKQCAIIAPTVILAWQHFLNVTKRFESFPVKIELLSRLQTKKEQDLILQKLREGKVDLVVGTHRLIQDDVIFRDLGLLIIDEEQRFGVAQKEKFKGICAGADILSVTATPIPRTLNMVVAKIRDMSVIEEAPQDRQIVKTYILEYSPIFIKEVMDKEIRRGGQVYYLHNSVQTIEETATYISKLLPEARLCIGHGKMSEKNLLAAWQKVINHEVDIFVCTTIIETGVDVPNVNTLVIENADKMGLSQLYQIRGRVGRSSRRGYAYFTFKKDKILTPISEKRLDAIREFVQFGSGLNIAMRDLELRGAGNILSADQHGHVSDVGYNMYMRLLSDAIKEQEGKSGNFSNDELCNVNLSIGAHIPENYIDNIENRLNVYREISNIRCREDIKNVVSDLTDRFGKPPNELNDLIEVAMIRSKATKLGISEIRQSGKKIFISFSNTNTAAFPDIISRLKTKITLDLSKNQTICFKLRENSSTEILNKIGKLLQI